MLGQDQIRQRFGFHKATTDGPHATAPLHAALRRKFAGFVADLDQAVPEGREKAAALDALQAASMWAHAAVASTAPLLDDDDPAAAEDPHQEKQPPAEAAGAEDTPQESAGAPQESAGAEARPTDQAAVDDAHRATQGPQKDTAVADALADARAAKKRGR